MNELTGNLGQTTQLGIQAAYRTSTGVLLPVPGSTPESELIPGGNFRVEIESGYYIVYVGGAPTYDIWITGDAGILFLLEDAVLRRCDDPVSDPERPVLVVKDLEEIKDYVNNLLKRAHIHSQGEPIRVWNLRHPTVVNPVVEVQDSVGNLVYGKVSYNLDGSVTIEFPGEFSGRAFLFEHK